MSTSSLFQVSTSHPILSSRDSWLKNTFHFEVKCRTFFSLLFFFFSISISISIYLFLFFYVSVYIFLFGRDVRSDFLSCPGKMGHSWMEFARTTLAVVSGDNSRQSPGIQRVSTNVLRVCKPLVFFLLPRYYFHFFPFPFSFFPSFFSSYCYSRELKR